MNSGSHFPVFLLFVQLVPFAVAGLALIEAGLGRSRSAATAMTSALCVLSTAVLVYFVWGIALQGPENTSIFGDPYRWIGPGFFFRHVPWTDRSAAVVLLPLLSVAISSLIPLGSASDRWRLMAACTSTVILAGLSYPVFSSWARHARFFLNATEPLSFLDAGGSGVINVTGGLTAVSVAWLLGPRRGKYAANGMPAAIPAHNAVFVLFGCMLAWVGWLGLNAAGAMLYAGAPPQQSVLVIMNTTFSAAAAALAAAAITRFRFRKPDASLIANGWMAGLVASSAGCATLKPATAILTGFVAGTIVVFSVEFLEFNLKIDDPCGSISVHAVCGIWGLLAAGIFSGTAGQFVAQLVGVATLLGLILPMTYGLNWLASRFIPYRVSPEGERQGLDLHELGADAYPEFVVHADEFTQR